MNNIQDLSKIRDNFLKLRIVVSVKNIKLASDRNKIKRRIKYFFIENYIKKQNNLTNKQEYFFITILKKQKEILNYKEIERQLNSML